MDIVTIYSSSSRKTRDKGRYEGMKQFSHRDRNKEFWDAKGKIPLWRISEKLNCHEKTLMAWLRMEVEEEKMQRIMNALEQVKQEL